MRRSLPLIRAASLSPIIRFLDAQGMPTTRLLSAAGLSYYPFERPEQPIAFLSALDFAMLAAQRCGVLDLGCRAADRTALAELGIFGQAVLHSPDVRSAFQRGGALMRHFSSHEALFLVADTAEPTVTVHFTRAAGLAELHIAEQYTAMLVRRLAEASGMQGSPFRSVAFSSDPFGSLESLRPWLGDELVVGDRPGLKMTLREDVLDRPLPFREAAPGPVRPAGWLPLGPAIGLREGLGHLLSTMLLGSVPTIGEVARVAGMSQRSLQRQLHAEGSSFRAVLDAQRRELALSYVHRPRVSLGELSQSLGYGHQSSLTRAFRRWTDESPRGARRERADAVGDIVS